MSSVWKDPYLWVLDIRCPVFRNLLRRGSPLYDSLKFASMGILRSILSDRQSTAGSIAQSLTTNLSTFWRAGNLRGYGASILTY